MRTTGIIAEFNPFHNGHKYLIDTLKKRGDRVVCVIGDDFTQRGDIAVISKHARTEAALACGADLCVLLPVPWSMSGAYNFAFGAVSIFKSLGNIDCIAFGSESGDVNKIKSTSAAAHGELAKKISTELKKGVTFAAARQNAVMQIIGEDALLLSNPNDTLATEYVAAAKDLSFSPEFFAVNRQGVSHDSAEASDIYLSASAIRTMIKENRIDDAKPFMPEESFKIFKRELCDGQTADIDLIAPLIISHLRRLSQEEIAMLPEISEGIENRVMNAVKKAHSYEECLSMIKSKRYTLARIRRILLSAFIGIDSSFFAKEVPYIKILGMSAMGEEIIKTSSINKPVISRGRDYLKLDGFAKKCFEIQNAASDQYSLATAAKSPCGRELTTKIIKI